MNANIIIIWILFGVISAYIANKKEKNIYRWFLYGALFGFAAIALILFLKPPKKPNPSLASTLSNMKPTKTDNYFWYYLDKNNIQKGPVSHTKIKEFVKNGTLLASNLVWNETMDSWKKISDIKLNQKTDPTS